MSKKFYDELAPYYHFILADWEKMDRGYILVSVSCFGGSYVVFFLL